MTFLLEETKELMKQCSTIAVGRWRMTTMKTYWADMEAPNETQLESTKVGSMLTKVKWEIMISLRSTAVGKGLTRAQIRALQIVNLEER